jgi:hypothetical protein
MIPAGDFPEHNGTSRAALLYLAPFAHDFSARGSVIPEGRHGMTGQLRLEMVDVRGRRLAERVDIYLRNQTLTETRAARSVDASKRILIKGLRAGPDGLYRVDVDPPSYQPVSWFVRVEDRRTVEHRVVLPVDREKVIRVEFPEYRRLPHAHALLEASGNVLDFAGKQGRDLYEALDDVRRAGLLNIIAKAHVTRFRSDASVLSYLLELRELRGDRFYATVAKELRENAKQGVQERLFVPASDLLHRPPDGFARAGSFKTPEPFGNLQLSFFASEGAWVADVDIDDAAGLGHVFQVVRNAVTNQPTHPFDINQILIHRQALDPGYEFVLYEEADITAGKNEIVVNA